MTDLWRALGICPGEMAAFTGGGGKTSLALTLVRELTASGRPPVFTTTTHIWPPEGLGVVFSGTVGWFDQVRTTLASGRPVCVASALDSATGKLKGISADDAAALKQLGCIVLVEADGSGGRPLKAPAPHEPVIPACADLVVPVAGASVLGRPLMPEHVHRAPYLAAAAGVPEGSPVTPRVVVAGLQACTRGLPASARAVPVLGQADLPGDLAETARQLTSHFLRAVAAAPATSQPVRSVRGDVAAIVLAGGAASRFGAGYGGKLIHRRDGATILERSLAAPLKAPVAQAVVVTGALNEPLARLLAPWPVRVVHNPDWAAGMATSMQAGLRALPGTVSAAIICLGDQPNLPPDVIRTLIAEHRRTGAPIVAPVAGGRRQNPVLFHRSLFPELMAVTGDEGGRSVIRRHESRMVAVPFTDPTWFADIDTQEDLST